MRLTYVHNDQGSMEIEFILLSSAAGLRQSALTIRLFLSDTTRNIETDDLTLFQLVRESWISSKISSIDCRATTQVRWNTMRLFSWNTCVFSRRWVEKINSCLISLNWLTYFKRISFGELQWPKKTDLFAQTSKDFLSYKKMHNTMQNR